MTPQREWHDISGRRARIVAPASPPQQSSLIYRGRRITRPNAGEDWASYDPQPVAKPKRVYIADNDNPVPAKRGKIVPLPSHSEIPQPPGRPTSSRVADALDDAERKILFRVRELLRAAEVDVLTVEDDTFGVETLHDVKPTVDAALQAYADGMRSFVRRSASGAVERFAGGISFYGNPVAETVTIGGETSTGRFFGIRFHRGRMTYYGQNGRKVKADYLRGAPRGSVAANDNWRDRTARPAAPAALAEVDRVVTGDELRAKLTAEEWALLKVIIDADSFEEIAVAAGKNKSSHNGRRIVERTLQRINKIISD